MSRSIQCVHCKSMLRAADPMLAGQRVRCPKCQQLFLVSAEATAIAVQPAPAPPPLPAKPRYEDDDTFDRLPARIKKKKRKGAPTGLIVTFGLLGGAGLLALVLCTGCGVGGYFLFFSGPRIAGQWELIDPQLNARVTVAFNKNGTGMIDGPAADVHFDYKLINDDPLDLEWRITRIDNKNRPIGLGPFGFGNINRPIGFLANNQNLVGSVERFRVTIENNILTTTPNNGGAVLKWRRIR